MFFTKDDLADRLVRQRWWINPVNSLDLVGNVGEFGHIVVNDKHKISILIFDEEKIMNVMEDFMVNHDDCMEQAIIRYMELRG